MSNPEDNILSQLAGLMADVEHNRNAELQASIQEQLAADEQQAALSGWGTLVSAEAKQLQKRVEFLHRHPKLPQFLGGSSLKMVNAGQSYGGDFTYLETPVMFQTEAEHAYSAVTCGVVFGITKAKRRRTDDNIRVEYEYQDVDTGAYRRRLVQNIIFNKYNATHPVTIKDDRYDSLVSGLQMAVLQAYVADNPELEERKFNHDGSLSLNHPTDGDGLSRIMATHREFDLLDKHDPILRNLMQPGNGWDYPTELYKDTLTNLKVANQQLSWHSARK